MTGGRPNPDEQQFEHEIHDVLVDMAPRPAPASLVARVAAIPDGDAARVSPWRRLFGGLAAVATVGAALIVVLLVTGLPRPSGTDGGPGGSGGAGSVVPTATSSTPTASGATSSGATAVPSTPAGAAVPAGFSADSATFISAQVGWTLGDVPCASGRCAAIVKTTDGGATWSAVGAPATTAGNAGSGATGVTTLRFANARDGWAFGRTSIWATHDGGAIWRTVAIPGIGVNGQVMALETGAGRVHAAVADTSGTPAIRIATSPVGSDAWALAATTVQIGAGPVPATQIVLQGSTGWLLEVDRTVVGGARLVGGSWVAWDPPCLGSNGPAVLTASSASELVAACNVGQWSTPKGEQLYASHDGGSHSGVVGAIAMRQVAGIAAADARTIVVGGYGTSGAVALARSVDGGRTWTDTYTAVGGSGPVDLGFTTPTQGIAVVTDASGVGHLLMTRDAGATWTNVLP